MPGDRKLDVRAQGEREIVITRGFDAPRRLVFDAWTRPELVSRWLGPRDWTMTRAVVDLRVGGAYRYEMEKPGVAVMGWGGVFTEVLPPARIVATERFDEGWYPGEALVAVDFAESNGRTTLTMTLRYESREARDIVLKSPMESGLGVGFDRMAELFATTERS